MKLTFRKSDRDAIIILILIILVVVVLFPLLREKEVTPSEFLTNEKGGHQYAPKRRGADRYVFSTPPSEGGRLRLFPFDPNTADSTQLQKLGLTKWQIRNIYKYRAKGGRYRQKEDFAMLYGLTLEHYRRLEPYIRIKSQVMARDVIKKPNHNYYSLRSNENTSSQTSELKPSCAPAGAQSLRGATSNLKLHYGETIDINTADTTQLKRIPGIGSYFARRIVELRQRRQAFLSPEELLVIRNFPESAIHYMTASQNFPKIHINHSTLQQLKSHPLINHTQASDILQYRRLNGDIRSATDMSLLRSFSELQLSRLAPFLLFD